MSIALQAQIDSCNELITDGGTNFGPQMEGEKDAIVDSMLSDCLTLQSKLFHSECYVSRTHYPEAFGREATFLQFV